MISDVLFEAEQQINEYLSWDNCPYGSKGDPFRERIELLVVEMRAVRFSPGLDCPPGPTEEIVHSDVPLNLEFNEAEALLSFLMDQINGGKVFDEKLRLLQRVRDKLSAQRIKTMAADA